MAQEAESRMGLGTPQKGDGDQGDTFLTDLMMGKKPASARRQPNRPVMNQ